MVPSKPTSWVHRTLKILGPGLVTGAADDDPSGIATYSSVGAQFGYGMLWTMPLIYPFMAGIQEISARLGRVTGRGIAGSIRNFYPAWMLYVIVASLLVANIINIGADIGAMGAAVAVLGTTISPYLLFWQSAEEVEQMKSAPGKWHLKKRLSKPRKNSNELKSTPTSEWRCPT
jgi:Mn2+/Fe2+ NRAMP family transporter